MAPSQNPWHQLKRYTSARIALGRSGGSRTTQEILDFKLSHAQARDAVFAPFEWEQLRESLADRGSMVQVLSSAAESRQDYLERPDHGRKLSSESRQSLKSLVKSGLTAPDVVIIIGDGLSPLGINRHAHAYVLALLGLLQQQRLSIGPLILVKNARVALEDEIGEILKAQCAIMLIGERPGLSSPDSMGIYAVFRPQLGRTDAERNCISNIRPEGLHPDLAAELTVTMIQQMLRQQLSGVGLALDRNEFLPTI